MLPGGYVACRAGSNSIPRQNVPVWSGRWARVYPRVCGEPAIGIALDAALLGGLRVMEREALQVWRERRERGE